MPTPSVKAYLPLLLVLTGLAGCASTPPAATTPGSPSASTAVAPKETQALSTPQERVQFHMMAGEMAAGRQQPGAAAEQFLDSLQDAPDAKVAARATALALRAGDDTLALRAARKWLEIDPSSGNAREAIIRLALRLQQQDVALQQCRDIIQLQSAHKALAYRLVAQLLSQEPEYAEQANAVMDQLVADDSDYAPAHEAAALLALRSNRNKLAESEARKALKLTPGAQDASLLLVAALIHQDRLDDADAVMDDLYRGNQADATTLRLGYAQLLVQAHHSSHAQALLRKIVAKKPKNDDARFLLALIDLNSNRLDEAEKTLHGISGGNKQQRAEIEYFLGRIDEARHQPNAALLHYSKVTSGSKALDAATRRAVLLAKLGRLDESEALLQKMSQAYPQLQDQFIVTESQILTDIGRSDDAAQLLEHALQVQPDNTDLLYSRSLVYEKLGRVAAAEADLQSVLKQTPDDPRALNALGYMLTIHNPDKLDQAQTMIAKALQATPDDPAVIDSMGWVLYRRGHPNQALPLLQKAYSLFPDPEVAAHLVAVLNALGDSAQAQQVLEKALKDNPSDPALLKRADQLNK